MFGEYRLYQQQVVHQASNFPSGEVSVQAQQGQLVAVTGPHGSGKATLLRLLGHVVFPQDGSIFIPSHLRVPW